MGLFEPAWMSRDEKKAYEAAKKTNNQNTLIRIVQESPSKGARIEAASKLKDQSIQANDLDIIVRKTAEIRLEGLRFGNE